MLASGLMVEPDIPLRAVGPLGPHGPIAATKEALQ